jgi:serine/threonine protein kinase
VDLRFTNLYELAVDPGPRVGRAYRAIAGCDRVDVWFRYIFPEVTLDQTLDERIIAQTEQEASLLFSLHHPSIISIVGTTVLQEGPALILEPTFCSVASALEKGPKSRPFAVRIAAQIASAVKYLHRRGVCHGAIDAENVLLLHGSELDPLAKLSNFSCCTRDTQQSQAARMDIEKLEVLINLLFRNKDNGLGGAIADLDEAEDLEALHKIHPTVAPIIQCKSGRDKLKASEIADGFARLDQDVEKCSPRLAAWLQPANMTQHSL